MSTITHTLGSGRASRMLGLVSLVALAFSAGCASRDSITVGSVPDDYRTNHPIVIAEKEEVLDLAVGAADRKLTKNQKSAIGGLLAGYDHDAAPLLTIMQPVGAANDYATGRISHEIAGYARHYGVPGDRVIVKTYAAGAPEVSAPIRITFAAMRAQTEKCGRRPADMLQTADNKHYADFGCSYQNNLAAQIANPNDLLVPRAPGQIDPENRDNAIDRYKRGTVADEFVGNSEVTY